MLKMFICFQNCFPGQDFQTFELCRLESIFEGVPHVELLVDLDNLLPVRHVV